MASGEAERDGFPKVTEACFWLPQDVTGAHLVRNVVRCEPPHAQSLFLFPIVFGINLIQFFDGKNNVGLGRIWSFVSSFRSLVARLAPFERFGTKRSFGNGSVNSLRISAPQWWPFQKWETGLWREKRKVRIFGKGKCKLVAIWAKFWQGKV